MRYLTRSLFLISLVIACHAAAQQGDPNNKRGFEAGKVYNFFGLDSVSPFSGNLTVAIPIGQSYSVRPGFSYQFFLTNNSRAWDYEMALLDSGGEVRHSVPERYSNAGLGWLLSLGRVLPPNNGHDWTYASPDGATHEFARGADTGVLYTTDNTYMRMKLTPRNGTPSTVTRIDVETADGLVHAFTGAGELLEIRDQYGNWVQVTRNGNVWTFEDGRGDGSLRKVARKHVLTLEDAPADTYTSERTNFLKRVKTLALAAFPAEGQTVADAKAVYTFQYDDTTIDANNCSAPANPDINWAPSATWNVPLLEQIDLPDGSAYVPRYHLTNTTTCSSGALKQLTLPTKGAISWTYGNYRMARDVCMIEVHHPGSFWWDPFPGVIKRTLAAPNGQILEQTGYVPELVERDDLGTIVCGKQIRENSPLPAKVFKNTVTSSDAGSTVHYFSAFRASDVRYEVNDAFPGDYGLPFTWAEEESRPLSTRTYDSQEPTPALLRSTYVEYETNVTTGVGQHGHPLPRRSETVFHDDTGDPQPDAGGVDTGALRCKDSVTAATVDCWLRQESSAFDGFGHYRTQTTTSNFPGSATRTVFTNYNAGVTSWPVDTPWVLNKYTTASVTEGSVTRSSSTVFDAKGTLISTQSGTGNGALVKATCRDAAGFITSERWLGGAALPPHADPCTAVRRAGEAFLVHENTFTGGALTTHTATWDGLPPEEITGKLFKAIDETLDANTGLPSSTRDGAGLKTAYTFDTSGRITSLDLPGVAETSYVYTNAALSATNVWTPATVSATTQSAVPALGAIRNEYQYDSVGRLWREKTVMPAGTWSVRETLYDAYGRRHSVSEMETLVTPAGGTEYSFTPAHKTTFGDYDAFGRVGTITAPDGKTTTFAYQGSRATRRTVNMALELTGESAVTTAERTDAHGRLTSVTEAEGTSEAMTTSYAYDVSGQLGSVTMNSPAGTQTRTFTYDARNLLTNEQHPEHQMISYSDFTAQGQARRKKTGSAAAFDLTMEYDAAGRLTLLKRSDGATLKQFRYDPATGRLSATGRFNYLPSLGTVAVSEGLGYHAEHGRLVRRDVAIGSSAAFPDGLAYATTRDFDDLGGVSSTGYPFRKDPEGQPRETQRSVGYSQRDGRLIGVTGWAALQYQPNGAISKVTHTGNVTETWTEDPDGMARPREIKVARGTTTHWVSGTYEFDGAGNIKTIGSLSYTYDGFGRLFHSRSGTSSVFTAQNFLYDPFGNRLGTASSGCTGLFQCYTTSVAPRAITGTTNQFADSTYDAAGNVTADVGRAFTYDSVNMTTSISAGGRTFQYLYTADDERVAAVESLAAGGYKTTWTLRGLSNELLTVLDGETWKEDRIWRGSTVVGFNTPAGKRHQSVDHLGTPRVITDDAGNIVGGIQHFTPFGDGGSLDAGALQFTGHERDRALLAGGTTALPDYMHARYYDVGAGRFLSVDPVLDVKRALKSPQMWNRYSYVTNNPLNRIDPDGRLVQMVGTEEERKKAFEVLKSTLREQDRKHVTMNDKGVVSVAGKAKGGVALMMLKDLARKDVPTINVQLGSTVTMKTGPGPSPMKTQDLQVGGGGITVPPAISKSGNMEVHVDPRGSLSVGSPALAVMAHELMGHAWDLFFTGTSSERSAVNTENNILLQLGQQPYQPVPNFP